MSQADTWRQKVYDSERVWNREHFLVADQDGNKTLRMVNADDAQAILDSLADSFDIDRVRVVVNPRLRQWAGWYMKHGRSDDRTPRIEVRRSVFEYKTMLHEFAHHLDAQRRSDHDGKGHGGSYARAMLDVVERHLNKEAMVDLMRSYEQHGVPIGAEETAKLVARARDGVRKRQQRHGTIEEAWSVRLTHERFGSIWVEQDKMSTDDYLSRAGVWKRKSTAEKVAVQAGLIDWQAEIVKVRAELDTLYSNRWWAREVIE